MEVKKSQKADLESKKTLFLEIGLCASLLLMIGAFAWGQSKREAPKMPEVMEEFVPTEEIENTVQDEPLPPVPTPANVMTILSDNIEIVDDNTQIETEQIFADFEFDVAFSEGATVGEVNFDMPEVFVKVSNMPKFQGGDLEKFRQWVQKEAQYPEVQRAMGIEGRVIVQFIVNMDGSLSDFEVISDTDPALNKEALRVVSKSPKWTPGDNAGKPARVRITIPVVFNVE